MLPIQVLVSHADPLTQAGLVSTLQPFHDFNVIGAKAAEDAGVVDVVVTDYATGLEYLGQPKRSSHNTRVLIVTNSDGERDIRYAVKQGVRGYVLQDCSIAELATAVRVTHSGNVHLCPQIAQRLAESLFVDTLTSREEEVLRCVVDGLCNKDVARRLDLAVGTVKSHLRGVFSKLGVKSRTHAVAVTERRGILQSNRSRLTTIAPN